MSIAQELLVSISAAAPSLRSWCDATTLDPPSVSELCTLLAAELEEHRRDGRIPELPALAPIIERMLDEDDEHDAVSLGFVEPLVWKGLDGSLDAEHTRTALGPTARSVWDDLYLGSRRQDLRAVKYDERDLGPAARTPAKLEEWLLRPNRWVDAEAPIARLVVSDRAAQLRVKVRCWVDRFATPAGHSLQDGDLLLYVAPESRGTPRHEPLCEVALSEPAA